MGYSECKWRNLTREKCHTDFVKRTINRNSTICINSTTIRCNIVECLDCEMTEVVTPYNLTMMQCKEKPKWNCTLRNITYTKYKYKLHCYNITRPKCNFGWIMFPNGTKVWDKTDCKNKTWEHCEPRKMPMNKTLTTTNCTQTHNVTW